MNWREIEAIYLSGGIEYITSLGGCCYGTGDGRLLEKAGDLGSGKRFVSITYLDSACLPL